MIVAKCPLRVSLAGGSTDLQDFIDQNGYGAVISFPSTLYTYISLHENNRGKYIIDYTHREEVTNPSEIKNDIAREVLKEYSLPPVTITFNTDAHSSGSGLASSSSYLIALIKAVTVYKNIKISNYEICMKALEIERRFNPLTGYQDPYGCGIGSLKLIEFYSDRRPSITYLDQDMFHDIDMHLMFTGIKRGSTDVLKKTIKTDRSYLLKILGTAHRAITKKDLQNFAESVKLGWEHKKRNTPHVIDSEEIKRIDHSLSAKEGVIAHRLCGAGAGGYFLILSKRTLYDPLTLKNSIKIDMCQDGVTAVKI
jgi:D-glycero-alpha-D-manno-heptose-7-phosphate kinase